MGSSAENLHIFEMEVLANIQNSPIYPVLMCLERKLKDCEKNYGDKVSIMVSVSQTITEFIIGQPSAPDITQKIIEFLYCRMLKVVLNSHWLKIGNVTKNHLCLVLNKCLDYFNRNKVIDPSRFIISLIILVKDPWGHPTLNKIMRDEDLKESEVIEFCDRETILLLGLRVRTLIDSKCEDLAVKIVNFIIQRCGVSINALIHLLIRIITHMINDIEKIKLKNDEINVYKVEKKLSNIFLIMYKMFNGYEGISRECLLTAFSLDPTEDIFKLIKFCNEKDFANQPDDHLNESIEGEIFVRALGALIPDTGSYLIKSVNYNPYLAQNDIIDECEKLKIPTEIAHDLILVISSQRYKRLSWVYDWIKLRKNCELYMKEGVFNMRNPTKELKYLKIDYSQFIAE